MRADDSRLLGIPRSRSIIAMIYPYHDARSTDYPGLSTQENKLVACISVARVRPRTSKGITDLLLPQTSMYFVHSPSKKSIARNYDDYLAG